MSEPVKKEIRETEPKEKAIYRLSESERKDIAEGEEDIKAGRTLTSEEARAERSKWL